MTEAMDALATLQKIDEVAKMIGEPVIEIIPDNCPDVSREDVEEATVEEAFDFVDKDGNGKISGKEGF